MVTNKAGNSTSTSDSMHLDFSLAESPDRPPLTRGGSVECGIACLSIWTTMPIVTISLNDQAGLLKHEVRLEAPKHRLVHLELQPSFPELVTKKTLNRSHVSWEDKRQSGFTRPLASFWRAFLSEVRPTYLLAGFKRDRVPKSSLAHSLTAFVGVRVAKKVLVATCGLAHPFPNCGLTERLPHLLAGFGGVFKTLWPSHLMFNYNIKGVG